MLMYLLMFAAAIRLRYHHVNRRAGFVIPGGKISIWIVAGAGFLGSIITFFIGFIPPANIQTGGYFYYESLLIIGLLIMSAPPLIIYKFLNKKNLKIRN